MLQIELRPLIRELRRHPSPTVEKRVIRLEGRNSSRSSRPQCVKVGVRTRRGVVSAHTDFHRDPPRRPGGVVSLKKAPMPSKSDDRHSCAGNFI